MFNLSLDRSVEVVSAILLDLEPALQSGKGPDARPVPKSFTPGVPVSESSPVVAIACTVSTLPTCGEKLPGHCLLGSKADNYY